MPRVTIDSRKCNSCATCTEICPMAVFGRAEGKVIVASSAECISCRACEAHCLQAAIKVEE